MDAVELSRERADIRHAKAMGTYNPNTWDKERGNTANANTPPFVIEITKMKKWEKYLEQYAGGATDPTDACEIAEAEGFNEALDKCMEVIKEQLMQKDYNTSVTKKEIGLFRSALRKLKLPIPKF